VQPGSDTYSGSDGTFTTFLNLYHANFWDIITMSQDMEDPTLGMTRQPALAADIIGNIFITKP